ncbi:MAG: MFS transporter [Ilumatobacteraceae bacterium]
MSGEVARRRVGVVLTGAGLVALSGPGQTAGFSVFVDPVSSALGVGRSTLSLAYLIGTLAASTTGAWLGRLFDRRSSTTVVTGVATALAVSLLVAAVAPHIAVLVIAIYGLRSFGQTGMTLSASLSVARLVTIGRGRALGLLTAIGGSAIALTPLAANWLIDAVGYRAAWVVLAGVVAVFGTLLAIRLGRLERATADADDGAADLGSEIVDPSQLLAVDPAPALGRNGYWLIVTAFSTSGFVATALAFHQVAILGERGLDAGAAAANFLPQSLAAATIALLVGRRIDRLPGRWAIVAAMSLLCLATCTVALVGSPPTAVLFGVMLGSAASATAASEGTLMVRWIGTATLGARRGRMMSITVVGTALAPLGFTLLADAVGSFTRAALLLGVVPFGVAVAAAVLPLPAETRAGAPDEALVDGSPSAR